MGKLLEQLSPNSLDHAFLQKISRTCTYNMCRLSSKTHTSSTVNCTTDDFFLFCPMKELPKLVLEPTNKDKKSFPKRLWKAQSMSLEIESWVWTPAPSHQGPEVTMLALRAKLSAVCEGTWLGSRTAGPGSVLSPSHFINFTWSLLVWAPPRNSLWVPPA
jgi:hypothetical protein